MNLIDLKRDEKQDAEEGKDCCLSSYEQDSYPVQMYIDDDSLEKMGITNLEVGKEMMIQAKVKVGAFSSRETKEGTEKSATLTVMAMGIDMSGKSAAQVLYGAKDVE